MLISVATVGSNIRRLRVAAGYKTGRAFAKALGIAESRLSDWENGRYQLPDTASLILIAKTLGVSVDAIIEGHDPAYDDARSAKSNRHLSPHTVRVTHGEHDLLKFWRAMPEDERQALQIVIRKAAEHAQGKTGATD